MVEVAARISTGVNVAQIGDPKIDSSAVSIDLIQQQWTNVKNKQADVAPAVQCLGVRWTVVLQYHVPVYLKKVGYCNKRRNVLLRMNEIATGGRIILYISNPAVESKLHFLVGIICSAYSESYAVPVWLMLKYLLSFAEY
jgi:hypothetical protein